MSKELSLHGIILKKTPYQEADEIVTLFTKELGKVRVKARGIKKTTSKLQYGLQVLSSVKVHTASSPGNTIPTVTQVVVLRTYKQVRESEQKVALFFWVAELLIKALPDEQKNEQLYGLMEAVLAYLDSEQLQNIDAVYCKFALEFLSHTGHGVHMPGASGTAVFFSNASGGFIHESAQGAVPVQPDILLSAQDLVRLQFSNLSEYKGNTLKLRQLLTGFISYQLERTIHSEKFLS